MADRRWSAICFVYQPNCQVRRLRRVRPTSSTSTVYWTLNASLQYQLRRAGLSASYNHGLTGGSGMLAGAETDIVTGSLSQQVSRTFNVSWNAGYSRNSGFGVPRQSPLHVFGQQNYSYWFAGVNAAHPFGRSLDVFVNYQLQYQNERLERMRGHDGLLPQPDSESSRVWH